MGQNSNVLKPIMETMNPTRWNLMIMKSPLFWSIKKITFKKKTTQNFLWLEDRNESVASCGC